MSSTIPLNVYCLTAFECLMLYSVLCCCLHCLVMFDCTGACVHGFGWACTDWRRSCCPLYPVSPPSLPCREVLVMVMRKHQRYFPIYDASSGGTTLLPRFLTAANGPVDPAQVAAGAHCFRILLYASSHLLAT